MRFRLAAAALVAVLAAGALSGCVGQPAPVETTPGFATEEEAFAAAEQTYRNYVDALNQVDLSDPKTFEPVYMWTTGEVNAQERKSLSEMHADGWSLSGTTSIVDFKGISGPSWPTDRLTARVCTDVSTVQVLDASGASTMSPTRPTGYTIEVTFTVSPTVGGVPLISNSQAIAANSCAL